MNYFLYISKKRKQNKGFTLIELMVSMAIIGILLAVSIASLMIANDKSRTIAAIGQLREFQTALELYANDHRGDYPDPLNYGEASTWCNWDVSNKAGSTDLTLLMGAESADKNGNGISFLDPLVPDYMSPANYNQILNKDSFFNYGYGGGATGGPCNCILSNDVDYALVTYFLTPIPGVTDRDECDKIGVIRDECGAEVGPYSYCLIKHHKSP